MAELGTNLAILYADVVDGSRPHEPVGSPAAPPDFRDHLALLEQIAVEKKARVVKVNGDGAMFAFPDADSSALAACEMQSRLQDCPSARAGRISIRIGLHCGEALIAGAVAQRMASFAVRGQIITTEETKVLLSAQSRNAIRQHVLPRRARQQTITVYEILWQPDVDKTQLPALSHPVTAEAAGPRLRIIFANRVMSVPAKITIGRRPNHDIPLKDPTASRDHAYIERRDDAFVLVDQSSHGTFIRLSNGRGLYLSNSEMVLRGSGILSFGRHPNEKEAELLSFWSDAKTIKAPK